MKWHFIVASSINAVNLEYFLMIVIFLWFYYDRKGSFASLHFLWYFVALFCSKKCGNLLFTFLLSKVEIIGPLCSQSTNKYILLILFGWKSPAVTQFFKILFAAFSHRLMRYLLLQKIFEKLRKKKKRKSTIASGP